MSTVHTRIANIDDIEVGEEAVCEFVANHQRIEHFAGFSLDTNALHLDAEEAQRCGFPRRVAHGMLTLSAVSRLIGTALPGHGSLWMSQDLRFVEPVFLDDHVMVKVVVERVSKAAGVVVLRTEATNTTTGSPVLTGTAKVRIPPRV